MPSARPKATRRVQHHSWPSPANPVPSCGSVTGRRRPSAGRWRLRSTDLLGVMLIEQLERVGDIGDVDLKPYTGCPLPEACSLAPACEPRTRELIDGLADADVTFPA